MKLKNTYNLKHSIIIGQKCCKLYLNYSERYGFKKQKGGKIKRHRVQTASNM